MHNSIGETRNSVADTNHLVSDNNSSVFNIPNLISGSHNSDVETHNIVVNNNNSATGSSNLVNDTSKPINDIQAEPTKMLKNSDKNSTTGTARSSSSTVEHQKPIIANCTSNAWNNTIIYNHTLVGGINAGDFREHGRKDNMQDCMSHCCAEEDCDLSFMIDQDCYTVKCIKPELCKTRMAKSTSFLPQIAFKIKQQSSQPQFSSHSK